MGSCQGSAREGEPVPSARRLEHNLTIIWVSSLHIRRRGRRDEPAETCDKDGGLSGIRSPEQILLFLLGQWQEGLKVSGWGLYRWSGVRRGCVGVRFDPPPLTPIVLREHKGSCQTLVVSASAKPAKPQQRRVWIWLEPPPPTNQEAGTEATVCPLKPRCWQELFSFFAHRWGNKVKYFNTSTILRYSDRNLTLCGIF